MVFQELMTVSTRTINSFLPRSSGGKIKVLGRWGVNRFLTDAELGFDARHTVVDINNFTDESIKLDVQVIEARFQNTETRIDCSFQPSEPCIHGIVVNDV